MVKREGFCLKWSSLSYISENNIESMACGPTILILGTVEGSSSYFGDGYSIMDISKRISDIFNSITDICNSLTDIFKWIEDISNSFKDIHNWIRDIFKYLRMSVIPE